MISGAHVIVYSTDAEADRAFFRDVLRFPSVDAGEGWLIFALPASEVAVHPAEENGAHALYLLCDDVKAFVAEMKTRGVQCARVKDRGWGLLTEVTLPGGGTVGVYQPRHARPPRGRAAASKAIGRTRARRRGGAD
jgi:catechol 2,3-dioxygenase-like lactoylglutathione lyase family enzyme